MFNKCGFGHERLNKAIALYKDGNIDKALEYSFDALNYFSKTKDPEGLCRCYNTIGGLNFFSNQIIKAIDYYMDGLIIARKNDLHFEITRIASNVGSTLTEIGEYDLARVFFAESEEHMHHDDVKEKDENFEASTAMAYINLLSCTCLEDRIEEAEKYRDLAKKYIDQKAWSNTNTIGFNVFSAYIEYRKGNLDPTDSVLDDLTKQTIEDNGVGYDIWGSRKMLFTLLMRVNRFDLLKALLEDNEVQAAKQGNPRINAELNEMWVDYYKALDDPEEYAKHCVRYVEFIRSQKKEDNLEIARHASDRIRFKENGAGREEALVRSLLDPLTELGNRYKLDMDYRDAVTDCISKGKPISVGILDVDSFKAANDTYGHITGDEYIKKVADCVKDVLEGYGGAYRYGGDEIVILMKADTYTTVDIAQKIKDKVEDLKLPNEAATAADNVTVSQGYCVGVPKFDTSLTTYMYEADIALYEVKNSGKNNYIVTGL